MENKRLMILGTNEYQNPVIVRAKELGYETHVYGLQRGEIGEKTADYFHAVDGILRCVHAESHGLRRSEL